MKPLAFCLRFFFAFLFVAIQFLPAFGQKEGFLSEEAVRSRIWSQDDPAVSQDKIPEKWKNKSAVFLYREEKYEHALSPKSRRLSNLSSQREVVKIQDKAALEDYSTLHFTEKDITNKVLWRTTHENFTYYGIRITKPSGETKILDLSEAVETEKEEGGKVAKKIAVAGLGVGDVLDFYSFEYEMYEERPSPHYSYDDSDPNGLTYTAFSEEYPVMKQKVIVLFNEEKFNLAYTRMNGAPDFQDQGYEEYFENKFRKYSMEQEMFTPDEFGKWTYPIRSFPIVKFRVYQIFKQKKYQTPLANYLNPEKTLVGNYEAKRLEAWANSKVFINKDRFVKMKRFSKTERKPEEYGKYLYVYLRYLYFMNNYYVGIAGTQTDRKSLSPYQRAFYWLSFAGYKPELLMMVPRQLGTADQIVSRKELMGGVRYEAEGKTYYLIFDTPHSPFNQIPGYLEGSTGFALSGGEKNWKIRKITLPVSSHQENQSFSSFDIRISDDFSKMNVSEKISHKGLNQGYFQDRLIKAYQYFNESHEKWYEGYFLPKEFDTEEMKGEQEDAIESLLADDFGKDNATLSDLEFEELAREGDKEVEMAYTASFLLKDHITRAGPNYLITLGGFLGSQVEVPSDPEERKNDIYMPFARSYENEIILHIPEGYEIKGVEKLNTAIMNGTGGFTSNARIEGDKLIINTKKFYVRNVEPAAKFPEMAKFLQGAMDFSQQKVLLTKKR